MAELARIAGVSVGTVSRALADSDLVNRDTREKIRHLARDHGFRPNQMASKLRAQRTGVIGLVIPLGHDKRQRVSDPFFMTMIGHLADEITESGHDLMLSRVIPGERDWLERIVGSGMLDGVLLIGQSDQFDTIERVAEHYRPMVVWGSHRDGQRHCSVGCDNVEGGRLAAAHLLDRGARSIAFFGDARGVEVEQRLAGIEQVVAERGGEARLTHVSVPFTTGDMSSIVASTIARGPTDFDAIVTASDTIAMVAIRHLHEFGIRVPSDVRVIGFDDLPIAMQTAPPLTTIRQDFRAGSKAMVDKLQARMAGEITPSLVMPPSLVIRASA